MKKFITLGLIAALGLSACDSGKSDKAKENDALNQATREELASAVAERDQLFSLYNDISQGMEQIKQLENILTVSNNIPGETTTQREQIMTDIAAIQKALQERREKLAELEKKLASSNQSNNTLRQTISNLRAQLESQAAEIVTLKDNLDQARKRIGELDAAVDSLNSTMAVVTDERNIAQEESVNLANELNTCYYAIGSKSELKERHIIETGFLRKTKLLKGDFDQSFFTTADKRTLSRIALHSKKAEIMTNQPEGSYIIDDDNGQKVLVITNPDAFWSFTNYLVIKID
ncbi:MAG: hypothetical protein K2J10_01900 [Muribaculaceae bacterium]|nr:hypothetical protein [Muribaculaceae bacterium]